jgi:adenosylhomocysteine nucleosidase
MLDTKARFCIIAAMDEEISVILERMRLVTAQVVGTITFHLGTLNHQDVLVFKSGVGLSMAAMSTSIALTHFKVLGILNIGTAGGLYERLNILDIVVCDRITYHDLDLEAFGTPRRFSPDNPYVFYADARYVDVFLSHFNQDDVKIGPLISGHQFIHQEHQIKTIQTHFPEAIAVEMEGAAIAHVASVFKIPFMTLRSISDLVHAPKNELSFDAYLKRASQRSADYVEKFIGLLHAAKL